MQTGSYPKTSDQPSASENPMNKHFKIGLVALALVSAPLVTNAVFAQNATQVTQMISYSKVFVQKLAGALGVDQAKLEAALKSAGNATVDEALKNQDITKTQASALKARVQAGEFNLLTGDRDGRGPGQMGGRGPGQMGGQDGRGIRGPGGPALMDATAKALGLSSEELRTQIQSGKTITEIAATKKVDLKTVQAAVLAAFKTQLEADVKAGKLTQAQADERLKMAQADPNFGLEFGRGGRGGPRR
jgi:hypothetical protein